MDQQFSYYKCAKGFLEERLSGDPDQVRKSQYGRVIDDLFDQGIKRGEQDSLDEYEFSYRVLGPIIDFVDQLACCFVSYDERTTARSFWQHRNGAVALIVSGKDVPEIDRDGLEVATRQYIELPVRHQRVDRLLVDALIAAEVFAFGVEMYEPSKIGRAKLRAPALRWHPLLSTAFGQLLNLILFSILLAPLVLAYRWNWIGDTVFSVALILLVGLLALGFLIAVFSLPKFWYRRNQQVKKITDLMSGMVAIYDDLSSSGLVSARRIRERASKAGDEGVGWPSSLFSLLDDIERRAPGF